jgi:hypothetical protein
MILGDFQLMDFVSKYVQMALKTSIQAFVLSAAKRRL